MSQSIVKLTLTLALVVACAITAQLSAQTVPPAGKAEVDKRIAILKSESATHKEKVDACRELTVIGTADCVPALAALLGDEKLSHMARQALEAMPDTSADDALRSALGTVKGRPRLGVIASLGVRRDVKAIEPLAKLLTDSDAEVVQVAARALGRIGTAEAAKALQAALTGVAPGNLTALCEGLFRAAEALMAAGQHADAVVSYDRLRSIDGAPQQVRSGALRGAILSRQKDGIGLLKQSLQSPDYLLVAAAVRTSMEMPGTEVTAVLIDAMGKPPQDNQVLLMMTLGHRGDATALPALSAVAKSGDKPLRIAAIRALPRIGDAAAVPVLAALMADGDKEVSQLAQEGLAAIPGKEADAVAMGLLESAQPQQKQKGIELISRRRMTECVPAVLKLAGDADGGVRVAAARRLGELCGPDDLGAILDLLMRAEAQQDISAAESAVSVVCGKFDKPESCSEKIAGLIPTAKAGQKVALMRVLATIGGPAALKAVRDVVNDTTAESQVRTGAIRVLGSWKTADAAPDLLGLAKDSANANEKVLCLRSYLGMAARNDIPGGQRLEMCREASRLVQRDEEKRLLLSALSAIRSPQSLTMIAAHIDNAGTKEEACAAAVTVAEQLQQGRNAAQARSQIIQAMEKVVKATANAGVSDRAKAVLQKAQG